jgi:hypothetical protein
MLWLLLAVRTERVTAYVLGPTVPAVASTSPGLEDARHAVEVASGEGCPEGSVAVSEVTGGRPI